jgi:hypothetical protein
MQAAARFRISGAKQITAPKLQSIYKARKKIATDLVIGDQALVDCDAMVTIINTYKCSACVELPNGDRSVINYDRLTKLDSK